jgi:hypothetical protein
VTVALPFKAIGVHAAADGKIHCAACSAVVSIADTGGKRDQHRIHRIVFIRGEYPVINLALSERLPNSRQIRLAVAQSRPYSDPKLVSL